MIAPWERENPLPSPENTGMVDQKSKNSAFIDPPGFSFIKKPSSSIVFSY
jgi:hypothetical protein